MSNMFLVEGWIAKDLQAAEGKNGPYVHFRLGEYVGKDKEPQYYQCTAHGDAMQRLQALRVKKGSRVLVTGQLVAEIGPKYENGQQTNEQEIKRSIFIESVRLTTSTNFNNQNQNAAAGTQQAGAGYPQASVPAQQNPYYGNYAPQQNQPLPQQTGCPTGQPQQQQYPAYPVQQQGRQNPAQQQQPAQQSNSYPPPPDDFGALPTVNFG